MAAKISVNVSNGLDSTIKILSTLRRKNYKIKNFHMKNTKDKTTVILTFNDSCHDFNLKRAVLEINKLIDVEEVIL